MEHFPHEGTLIDLLEDRAMQDPSLDLFQFVPDGEGASITLQAADLAGRARDVGAWLAAHGLAGQRIVLLFPPGLEFIEAFFGCVYAGAVAAPAPMPHPSRLERTLPRLQGMIVDARPAVVLTNREGLRSEAQVMASFPGDPRALRWLAIEDCPRELRSTWRRPPVAAEAPVHLQYTSGSTSAPKGTIITHANILANSRCIQLGGRYSRASRSVVWVPHFHDDGLIQGLLQPVFTGFPCALFPASVFVARPERWLQLITLFRATNSGGPNFAYELCIRKVSDAQSAGLDLSSWQMAYNAAEPVRAETLRRFYAKFAPFGLRWSTLAPGFGLAEATLVVSAGLREDGPRIVAFDGAALERQGLVRVVPEGTPGARTFVGCGGPALDTAVVIVDPVTGERCPPDRPGEVFVGGPSIAAGYFDRPDESERMFRARLPDGSGPYLRTGDQGFLLDGELFITGRIKDILIIRGENRYPQDIECSVERCHPAVVPGCVIAFAVEECGEERLGVAAEVKGKPGLHTSQDDFYQGILNAIREVVSREHDLRPWSVVLLAPGNLPKTSSGKLQRRGMARAFVEGTLPFLARFTDAPAAPRVDGAAAGLTAARGTSAVEIEVFLTAYFVGELGVRREEIGPDVPFSRYGLDSASSVRMAADLAAFIGASIPPIAVWNYPNIRALSLYLAGEDGERTPRTTAAGAPGAIAIIGAACRFPGGVTNLDTFWRLLEEGIDAVEEVPRERWDIDAMYDPDPDAPGKVVTRWGGFLRDIDRFEPAFFETSPREAAAMDPQQRLLLEVSWEALEAAGQTLPALQGSDTGVFMGISSNEYQAMGLARAGAPDPHLFLGTAHSTGVGRLSYWLGLRGPNVPVDTACSSSLVAVHLACQALHAGDCSMALAGGVNLMLTPEATVCLSRLRALSPSGRCHTFSADADGYVRGEGCGVVVLKRLADAERDHDPILAVIRGSAVNQDGRSHGLTAPSGPAQEDVIRRALARAGVEPGAVGYVETHGTGTPLGDPIEVGALRAAVGAPRPDGTSCVLGAVKTNIGHLEAAAGMAGLIKAIVALRHERIPKNLHFRALNPHITLEGSALVVATEAVPWPRTDRPRLAGVSSFGISGTNTHVVLEEAPAQKPATAPARSAELCVLAARSAAGLDAVAARLREQLAAHPAVQLGDIAFSLATTRSTMEHRLAVVTNSCEALGEALAAAAAGQTPAGVVRGRVPMGHTPKLVFVFSGQGSQWVGMGRQLAQEEPVFSEVLSACAEAIRHEAGFSVIEELERPEERSRLSEIDVVQPALFAIQVALAALWRSWGFEPDMVVGHSMGEVAAAHVAGALTLKDAVAIICRRSRLLRRLCGQGEMAVVELSLEQAEAVLVGQEARLSVAVSNSPRSTVVAGEPAALAEVLDKLEAQGVFCRRVKVDVAGHSPQVDPLREELVAALARIEPLTAALPMRSTVTGVMVSGPELVASYWADNLRQPVRFADAVQTLLADGHGLFVEISPHPLLTPAVEEMRRSSEKRGISVGSLRRGQPERAALLEGVGALWGQGHAAAWARLFPLGGRRVPLPTYPWQRERHWIESSTCDASTDRRGYAGGHPLLGTLRSVSTHAGMHLWETALDLGRLPWLRDHQVQGAVVLPGAAYLEMALSAGTEVWGPNLCLLTDVVFSHALALASEGAVPVQLVATEEQPGHLRWQLASRAHGGAWTTHARGTLRRADPSEALERLEVSALRARMGDGREGAPLYAQMSAIGLAYGPAFRGLVELWRKAGEALARLHLPEAAGSTSAYQIHPALLDACFQAMVGVVAVDSETTPWIPVGVGSLRLFQRPSGELWCHLRSVDLGLQASDRRSADIQVLDAAGGVVAEIRGLVVERLARRSRPREADGWFLELDWEPASVPEARVTAGRFVLLGEGGGFGAALKTALEAAGHAVVHRTGEDASSGGLGTLLENAFDGRPPTGVVHLDSLDGPDAPGGDDVAVALQRACDSVLATVQALAGVGYRDPPRLWIVTCGAQAVGGGDVSVMQAPVVGLGRVIAMEHAELRCTRVDLDPTRLSAETGALLAELSADDNEEEIALRCGRRLVARLMPRVPEAEGREKVELAGDRAFRLAIDGPGVLEHLVLREAKRRAPGPGEVEIAVEAAGLNHLDVLLAMGVMPNDIPGEPGAPLKLGCECAGHIIAVGEGVLDLSVGQPVLAMVTGGLASHVTTSAVLVLPRPMELSATDAAAMPVAYLTAWYALDRLARLQPGERVLIHAATGGVGLAALQWARHVGAEIYATAGSPEKRAYLASLGVKYVSDSRSDQFVADVLAWTDGEGVDVVLNSLAGELINKSFALLRSHGRFVELGKRDYYADHQLGLRPFLRNLSFSLLDLRGMMCERPTRVRALFQELLGLITAGVFTPAPTTTLPIGQAIDAFRKMAEAQHIGKLVLTLHDPDVRIRVGAGASASIRADGTYLVTGGLGGLGLGVAAWLAEQGAGHLVLLGRSGAASVEQQAAVAAIEARGACVTVARADVADRGQLGRILDEVTASTMPLRGIIHAAGVLDDGLLMQQTPARFQAVMAPKSLGAWHLHALTRELPLDFFVLYASGAGLLGSPGQGNYAAANTFLDALAHHRRAQGLPALSIDWGVFSKVGLAAVQDNRGVRLAARGMGSLTPDEGLSVLERLLASDRAQVGVVPFDVRRWVEFYPGAASSRRLSRLMVESRHAAVLPAGDRDLRARLTAAEPGARGALLQQVLLTHAAQVLRLAADKIDVEAPLTSLGMDSLMALELRNRIETTLGIAVPATVLWKFPTLASLTTHLNAALGTAPAAVAPDAEGAFGALPLSSQQEVLFRSDPVHPAYTCTVALRVRSPLDRSVLQRALQAIVDRHAGLRTTFEREGGRVTQRVHARMEVHCRHVDAGAWTEDEMHAEVSRTARLPFDLRRGPLVRVAVFTRSQDDHVLLLDIHHLIVDAWSFSLILDELQSLYVSGMAGDAPALPPVGATAVDYARWQAGYPASHGGEEDLAFWRERLAQIPQLDLPTDFPRPSVQTLNGATLPMAIDEGLVLRCRQVALAHQTTLYVVLLAAFQLLLHRLSGQNSVVVASPTTGRTRREFADTVGYLAGRVLLRSELTGDPSFASFLASTGAQVRDAFAHEELPFTTFLGRLHPPEDRSRFPFFQVSFSLNPAHQLSRLLASRGGRARWADLEVEAFAIPVFHGAWWDLSVDLADSGAAVNGGITYNTDLFAPARIARIARDYLALLEEIAWPVGPTPSP